jgi:hypothetical protein
LPNSDFTASEHEPPPPSQEQEVQSGKATQHVAPPVLVSTLPAYTHVERREGSAYEGRSSSVEGGDGSQELNDEDDFYGTSLSKDTKGWPLELLHRPWKRRHKCWRRRSTAVEGELG